jgi:phage tail-like protein
MNGESENNFLHLNRDGRWPDFQWEGLELRADGALQLYPLPRLEGESPATLAELKAPDGPAGIVVSAENSVYFSEPTGQRIFTIAGCDGALAPVPCVGGEGGAPVNFAKPRGLLIPKHRPTLFVADSENHRVQAFDLATWQLVDVWGQTDVANGRHPSAEPGRFDTPWALAGDPDGNVYVVDYGNQRVQKFNRAGELAPSFWETLRQANCLRQPSDIAVAVQNKKIYIYIIDQAQHAVFVFNTDGNPVLAAPEQPLAIGANHLRQPMGIAVSDDAIYVGDNERRRVLKFKKGEDYGFVGEAGGYQGPVAALALDGKGNLLVHSGAAVASRPLATGKVYDATAVLLRLALDKAYGVKGVLWSQAIQARDFEVRWHRLQAMVESLSEGAHLRLFVHTAADQTAAPVVNPEAVDPFADQKWRPRVEEHNRLADVTDLFIGGEPARYLWIGALFTSDTRATPVVSQLRVEFDHETYLQRLPTIYRNDSQCGDFLTRFLSLFESFFSELETKINNLPTSFDPQAARTQFLPWLAGWLALELDENWNEDTQRRIIAEAFAMYSRRGAVEGLREALHRFARVEAIIEEPIRNSAWWALPTVETSCACEAKREQSDEKTWTGTENSILGVSTMLVSAEAQGAVVGTTATLDASHLITTEEFGAPLFEDVAHQFSVQVYRGQMRCAETLPQVRAVIEREKPAHTAYHLCIVEPRMRVGFQARIGIDAVIAGPPMASKLGEETILNTEAALGGQPSGRIGERSRIGQTTRVG